MERRAVVEKIAEVIIGKKLPALLDVRDECTADVPHRAARSRRAPTRSSSWRTSTSTRPLSPNVQVNLTCLVPTDNEEVAAPRALEPLQDRSTISSTSAMEVVTRRLEFELGELEKRIHILEGFAIIFDALDETIRIIRTLRRQARTPPAS